MVFTNTFQQKFVSSLGMLTSCANTHGDPFVYANLSGALIGANPLFLSLVGAEKIEEVTSLEKWLHPQGVDLSFLLSQSGEYRGKMVLKTQEYHVAIRSEVIVLGDELIVAIALRDMSVIERARAAERYFERFKKKLLTNISHEFRTPMNAIIGFIDLLKSSPLSSWQEEYVEMASSSASSMMTKIENLLELMQVESGAIGTNIQPFNPLEVYENFLMQFDELIREKEIRLSVVIDPRLPLSILGDQDKILTILRNLFHNSIKFTPQSGQVLLEVLILKKDQAEIEVEYAISDTGIGIEKDRLTTLLRPFASAWENQRHGQDGMGVGLSLSHKYIDMMNSHLMLASEAGKGSRFSFRIKHPVEDTTHLECFKESRIAFYAHEPSHSNTLLLHKYLNLFGLEANMISSLVNPKMNQYDVLFLDIPHLSVSQVESLKTTYPDLQIIPILDLQHEGEGDALRGTVTAIASLPLLPRSLHKTLCALDKKIPRESMSFQADGSLVVSEQQISLKNAKILVAEDNLINLRLLETILKQHHFQVTLADNGQKAVDAYLKEPFDLVLMDIDMPVMDGLMANRLIKEIDKRDNRGFTPVIALTAHALIGDRERILGAGLDAHLAKPIDKNFLLQTIEGYLKQADQKRKSEAV